MPTIPTELEAILALLHQGKVRFIVVGGIAMRLHGCTHITEDVDVSYARDRENLKALAHILSQRKARLRGVPEDVPFVLDEFTFRNVQNLTLDTDLGAIDLLAVPDGVDSFDGLWERAAQMDLLELLALKKLIAEEGADDGV